MTIYIIVENVFLDVVVIKNVRAYAIRDKTFNNLNCSFKDLN